MRKLCCFFTIVSLLSSATVTLAETEKVFNTEEVIVQKLTNSEMVTDPRPGLSFLSRDSNHYYYAASKDGNHYAYVAANGKKLFVVKDGQQGPEFDGLNDLLFSADEKRFAYSAKSNAKWRVVVDDQPAPRVGPEYDEVFGVTFSADGKRFAYSAKSNAKWRVVVDDQPAPRVGPEYDEVFGVTFSPDGKRLGYLAKSDGKWLADVDDQPGPRYDFIPAMISFSLDSKHLIYRGVRGRQWLTVVDQQVPSEVDSSLVDQKVVFNKDMTRMAYQKRNGSKWFIVIDNQPGPEYDGVSIPAFSPDGKHLSYLIKKDAKWQIVTDGQLQPDVQISEAKLDFSSAMLTFDAEGKHVAYVCLQGRNCFAVVDGIYGKKYDGIGVPKIIDATDFMAILGGFKHRLSVVPHAPVFSPDGKRVAYGAVKSAKALVVVDNTPGKSYHQLLAPPFFSPDSKHYAYCVENNDEYFVVLDGQRSPAYSYIFNPETIKFKTDSSIEYLAMKASIGKDPNIYRIKHIPTP